MLMAMTEEQKVAFGRLLSQTEEALGSGLTEAMVLEAVRCGISSIEADRVCALQEEGRDPYPWLEKAASEP